jgi:hypothetical protein
MEYLYSCSSPPEESGLIWLQPLQRWKSVLTQRGPINCQRLLGTTILMDGNVLQAGLSKQCVHLLGPPWRRVRQSQFCFGAEISQSIGLCPQKHIGKGHSHSEMKLWVWSYHCWMLQRHLKASAMPIWTYLFIWCCFCNIGVIISPKVSIIVAGVGEVL